VRARQSENLFEWEKTEPIVKKGIKEVEKKGEVMVILSDEGERFMLFSWLDVFGLVLFGFVNRFLFTT
jgi:hypothetical protein